MRVASIISNDITQMQAQIAQALPFADVIELRLDYLSEVNPSAIAQLRQQITLPVIFTLRKVSQGGKCTMPEQQRLFVIQQLAMLLPDYLDLEYDVPVEFANIIHSDYPAIQLIRSYHDFSQTPEDLPALFNSLQHPSFASIKIATHANTPSDALRLLIFIQTITRKHQVTGIAMGEYGQVSRIIAPVVGSLFTYGSVDDDVSAAPGQLTLKELTETYRVHTLNRETQIYALLGHPVSQSPGHIFHNQAFTRLNKNAVYVKLNIAPEYLSTTVPLLKQLPFAGFSVTIPHKETMLQYVDELVDDAQEIHALNTIRQRDNRYQAFNTDGVAAADVLTKKMALSGKPILILGAGGSAIAIAYALMRQGAMVTLCNRTLARAEQFVQRHGGAAIDFATLFSSQQLPYHVIINTLPANAFNQQCAEWQLPRAATDTAIAMDIVLKPLDTLFLQKARAVGYDCIGGDALYVGQALRQLQLWFDLPSLAK